MNSRGDQLTTKSTRGRGEGPGTTPFFGRELLLVLAGLAALLSGMVAWTSGEAQRSWMVSLMILAIAVIWVGYVATQKDVLNPLGVPLGYVWMVVSLPWLFVMQTDEPLWRIDKQSLDGPATAVMALLLGGWMLGSLLVVALSGPKEPPQETRDLTRYRRQVRTFARLLLLILLAGKVAQVGLQTGPYGAGQTSYGAFAAVTTILEGLLPVAVLLCIIAREPEKRWVLAKFEVLVILIIAAIGVVALGSRSEFLAPVVVLVWGQSQRTRIGMGKVLVAMAVLVPLLASVAFLRTGEEFSRRDLVERSLVDISSPYVISAELVSKVPAGSPYLGGDTYVSAARFALPGFISRRLGGDEIDTASFRYRELARITNANQGIGFAFPAESYWNWGLSGVFIVSVVVSALVARFYWIGRSGDFLRVRTFVYPILVSAIPYGVRSDSLGQFKMTVYPIVILWVVFILSRAFAGVRLESKR